MPTKAKAPHHCGAPEPPKGQRTGAGSIPRPPFCEWLDEYEAEILADTLLDRLAAKTAGWLKYQVEDRVDRRIADLLDIEPRELARMVQRRRWIR